MVISEVMYHPVLEEAAEDAHEFVELANRTDTAIALSGWRLDGGPKLTFPAGVSIPARSFLVVAKNKQKLLEVTSYGLSAAQVIGDYADELDNGGGRVALRDASGAVVDDVVYDDEFPWPIGADALGAGEAWLPADLLPLANHQHRGRSLERVSFELSGNEVSNWIPSKLDAPTPGKANSVTGVAPVIVEALSATAENEKGAPIGSTDRVRITAKLSKGAASKLELEYFVDDVERTDELHTKLPMAAVPAGQVAILPAQKDGAIVRYRVVGDLGSGQQPISPRPTDPNPWHAYAVSPPASSASRLYRIWISPQAWGDMWANIQAGSVGADGCAVNPKWDARVPAVFVAGDRVYDVRVRYQGSRINRRSGREFPMSYGGPKPIGGPAPLRALSWSLSFPSYGKFEGRRTVLLNKLTQGCPGLATYVGTRMMTAAGVTAQRITRYARLHVNGAYYHYIMELDQIDADLLEKVFGAAAKLGDLFKVDGGFAGANTTAREAGPWAWGDENLLGPFCGFATMQRYNATYERKTSEWKGDVVEVVALIEELHKARAAGLPAVRKYFADNFDLDELLNYRAVMNWLVPGDDFHHNHFLYRRPDKKWILLPQDYDLLFGGWTWTAGTRTVPPGPATWEAGTSGPSSSFYVGEQNDRSGRWGFWNYLTDAFLKAYRAEYHQRLKDLSAPGKALNPAFIKPLIDEVAGLYDQSEANGAPGGSQCQMAAAVTAAKEFVDARHTRVMQELWK